MFANNPNLDLLNLPELEAIQYSATFAEGTNFKKVVLTKCKSLNGAGQLFREKSRLEEIDLSSLETWNSDYIFYNCDKLTEISLPKLTVPIPYYGFKSCDALVTISVGPGCTELKNESVCNCAELKNFDLSNIKIFGNYCLCDNPKLSNINSLASATSIGREAFRNCTSLAIDLVIPASCTYIGYRAFYNTHLTSVTMEATTPPQMDNESFSGALSYPIYVPTGSVDAYKNATNWRNIASRIFAAP
jgi:hypothetical protein